MKFKISFVLIVTINACCAIYVIDTNVTSRNRAKVKLTPAQWTEPNGDDGLWSAILEDWTLSQTTTREGRVLQPTHKYIPTNGFYISKRIGEAIELDPQMRPPLHNHVISNPIPTPSISSSSMGPSGGNKQSTQSSTPHHTYRQNYPGVIPSPREVSETDLYLLGAIEKLVYRVDYMEKRLRRSEQLIYYLMAGNNQREEPCPGEFFRVGQNCYHFGTQREQNWKSASTICKSLNAHLAEFETVNENQQVMAFLLNHPTHKGKDFWLGGLNPGLLWIWSNSAKPVNPNANLTSISNGGAAAVGSSGVTQKINGTKIENGGKPTKSPKQETTNSKLDDNLEVHGNGRCLRYSYNPALHKYNYSGVDCSLRFFYMCEYKDQTLDNEISRISKELRLPDVDE